MQASQVKFGIEIECFVPQHRLAGLEPGRYHNGNQITRSPRPNDGWNSQRDGSLRPPRGYAPVEVVSPILAGLDGLSQVWYMLDYLNGLGAKVNSSCGLHIHLDAGGLDDKQIEHVVKTFVEYEVAFYGLSGSAAGRRWDNPYCANSHAWASNPYTSRYQSLNLTNLHNHKQTIEIRCFAGTLDETVIMSAVYMAVALVAKESERSDDPHARTLARHVNPESAGGEFIGRFLRNARYCIVPDESPNDVIRVIRRQTGRAARSQWGLALIRSVDIARQIAQALVNEGRANDARLQAGTLASDAA